MRPVLYRAVLYRVFLTPLTVFFALALVFSVSMPAKAAGDEVYTVKGIAVDVSGTSALDARSKAFAEARRQAYVQLAARLLPEAERPNLVVPEDRVIASTVRDFEIVNEKMTSRRYAGTVDVRFTPAAVKRTMAVAAADATPADAGNVASSGPDAQPATTTVTTTDRNGVVTSMTTTAKPASASAADYVYSPRQAGSVSSAGGARANVKSSVRPILVLPWYGPMGRQTLWTQGNPWRAAWEENAALSRDKTTPIILPVGDVEDFRDYSPPQPLSRRGDIESLLKRYQATDAVLALAEPVSDGGVIVSLYRYDNNAPVPMGRFGVDSSSRDVLGDAVAKAAQSLKALPAMQAPAAMPVSLSTETPVADVSSGPVSSGPVSSGPVRTLARFSGLQQWVAMRQALARVPGVGAIGVKSISPSQASIEFAYNGDPASLVTVMAQNGLQMTALPANAIVSGQGATPQYLLSMGGVY